MRDCAVTALETWCAQGPGECREWEIERKSDPGGTEYFVYVRGMTKSSHGFKLRRGSAHAASLEEAISRAIIATGGAE